MQHAVNHLVCKIKADFKDKAFQDQWRLKLYYMTSLYNKLFKLVHESRITCRIEVIVYKWILIWALHAILEKYNKK